MTNLFASLHSIHTLNLDQSLPILLHLVIHWALGITHMLIGICPQIGILEYIIHLLSSLYSFLFHMTYMVNVTKCHYFLKLPKMILGDREFVGTCEILIRIFIMELQTTFKHRLHILISTWWTNRTSVQINEDIICVYRNNSFLLWTFLHTYIDWI